MMRSKPSAPMTASKSAVASNPPANRLASTCVVTWEWHGCACVWWGAGGEGHCGLRAASQGPPLLCSPISEAHALAPGSSSDQGEQHTLALPALEATAVLSPAARQALTRSTAPAGWEGGGGRDGWVSSGVAPHPHGPGRDQMSRWCAAGGKPALLLRWLLGPNPCAHRGKRCSSQVWRRC